MARTSMNTGAVSQDDRIMAVLAHLSIFIFPFIIPLVVWAIEKDKKGKAWVTGQAKQVLAYQIGTTVLGTILAVVMVIVIAFTFGIGVILAVPLFGVYALAVVLFPVYAAIECWKGVDYRYPFFGDLWK